MILIRTYRAGAEQNEKKTLAKELSLSALAERIKSESLRATLTEMSSLSHLRFWDFGVRASNHITIGDTLYLLIEGQRRTKAYHGKVAAKLSDPHGEIGDIVGWHRLHQQPWKNPVLLRDFVELEGLYSVIRLSLRERQQIEDNLYKLDSA